MGNCVSSKSTTGNVVKGDEYTNKSDKKSKSANKEETPAIVTDTAAITVNKEGSMRDDNSIFDINTSSKTLDTLGINKITDDKASTASLKSFPISENAAKIKQKETASLNAVTETTENSTAQEEVKPEDYIAKQEEASVSQEEKPLSNSNENNSSNNDDKPSPKVTQPAIVITQDRSASGDTETVIKNVTPEVDTVIMDASSLQPSAGVTSSANTSQATEQPKPDVDEFTPILRMFCAGSNNKLLFEKCKKASELTLERSMNIYGGNGGFLFKILKEMKTLSIINLSGLYMGPVAFRAVLTSMKFCDSVKCLNLSDNMADFECCDLIADLLTDNCAIVSLNLSGNMLGKESLSKSVGRALLTNSTLNHLDISSCGVSSFHAICEAIRMNEKTSMLSLNFCHNSLSDEQQFVIDMSLLLEEENCQMNKLNLSGMGITSTNMEAFFKSFTNNKSLQELIIGQNEVQSQNVVVQFISEACTHPGFNVLDLNNTSCMESVRCQLNLVWPNVNKESDLIDLSIANCSLDDSAIECLASTIGGRLKKMQQLNISGNNDITENGFKTLSELFDKNAPPLHNIALETSTNTEYFIPSLKNLPQVKKLSLRKSKLNETAIKIFEDFPQDFEEINLDSIKLGATTMLKDLLYFKCCVNLTAISLSNCILNDRDIAPVTAYLKMKSPKCQLESLDLSINRLTDVTTKDIVEALLSVETHSLRKIDFSNNQLRDSSLHEITKLFTTAAHQTNLVSINLANNSIRSQPLMQFISCLTVKNNIFPLSNFDLRSQNEGFNESDMEDIAEALLSRVFGVDDVNSCDFDLPEIKNKFTLHLTNLGGTAGDNLRSIDSAAIKTDLVKVKKMTGCLADSMEIFGHFSSSVLSSDDQFSVILTMDQWIKILGQDSPKWMQVNTNLKKCVFVTHMPATVTHQRLEGLLEMEADCNIKDIYLLKDPIVRKPTGSAWLLFEDEESVSRAIDWFVNGEAQMYGTPFSICRVPVVIDDDAGAEILARKELESKEKTLQRERQADRNLLEQSEKLAAERAAYREAHPAYQNGRIS